MLADLRGSIPALTGKPERPTGIGCGTEVYPRAHGEAGGGRPSGERGRGLSPRSRGSRDGGDGGQGGRRSIPALTGKPARGGWPEEVEGVYPRAHGEAASPPPPFSWHPGLSPRSRGSPERWLRTPLRAGSIPALTGKPPPRTIPTISYQVYPRAHGEAGQPRSPEAAPTGLSPRSRGSPAVRLPEPGEEGSIPALTGKPGRVRTAHVDPEVYPRAHGEAVGELEVATLLAGLSPRSRGSPRDPREFTTPLGSIPALTGKPGPAGRLGGGQGVYPRAHGEALASTRMSR